MFMLVTDACSDVNVLRVFYFVKLLLKYVFILVPIALIAFISFDLFKNVVVKDDSEMKNNVNLIIRRLIYAVILFLVPFIVKFFINSNFINSNFKYSKCLNVTKWKIDNQIKANKDECVSLGNEWDEAANSCVLKSVVPKSNVSYPDSNVVYLANGNGDSNSDEKVPEGGNGNLKNAKWQYYNQCMYGQGTKWCDDGCGPTSVAVIAQGLSGKKANVKDFYSILGGPMPDSQAFNSKILNKYGLSVKQLDVFGKPGYTSEKYVYSDKKAKAIKKAVDDGKGVLLHVNGHWVAVGPGKKCKKGQVFLYDVGWRSHSKCYYATKSGLWNGTHNKNGAVAWISAYAFSKK